MLTMNLAKDCWKSISPHKVLTAWYTEGERPCGRYAYHKPTGKQARPPIADTYDLLVKMGLSNDAILYKLIDLYVPMRYFNMGHFKDLPKVIGFIGPRGSGKTASAVNVAIFDWLLSYLPVYSNVDIAVRVVYKGVEKIFRSQPLEGLNLVNMDIACEDGLVLVDEINMVASESSRHMSSANLAFSYAMQQIRKRRLNVVWTAQGFNWIDNRTRWQTDWVVSCRDCYNDRSFGATCPGDKSRWQVYEISGLTGTYTAEYEMRHKWVTDYPGWSGMIWNQPIWYAFDTYALQGGTDYVQDYKLSRKAIDTEKRYELAEARQVPARELVQGLINGDVESIYADNLWSTNGITDKGTQMSIGRELQARGYRRKRDGSGKYFYEKRLSGV